MTSIRMPKAPLASATLAAALALVLAGPAFAQSSPGANAGSNAGSNQQAGGQGTNQGTNQGSSQGGQSSQMHAMSQAKLRQQLTQAGFTDVQVLDAAYLVQAKTGDGNTVMMMINPPSTGMQNSAASGASTSGKPASSTGSQSR